MTVSSSSFIILIYTTETQTLKSPRLVGVLFDKVHAQTTHQLIELFGPRVGPNRQRLGIQPPSFFTSCSFLDLYPGKE